jgi:hypothetical protein
MTNLNRLVDLMRQARQRAVSERSLVMPTSYSSRRGVSHALLCLDCKFYNPTTQAYLRCAVHPEGPPTSDTCPDKEER